MKVGGDGDRCPDCGNAVVSVGCDQQQSVGSPTLTAADLVVTLSALNALRAMSGWDMLGFSFSRETVDGLMGRIIAELSKVQVRVGQE